MMRNAQSTCTYGDWKPTVGVAIQSQWDSRVIPEDRQSIIHPTPGYNMQHANQKQRQVHVPGGLPGGYMQTHAGGAEGRLTSHIIPSYCDSQNLNNRDRCTERTDQTHANNQYVCT